MKHYSIWLEKYASIKEDILRELQASRKMVQESLKNIPENEILKPLKESETSVKGLCFVDGGEGIIELMGASMYFIRASGLYIDEYTSDIKEEFIRDLDLNMIDYDDYTKERVELLRDAMEFDVALECVKKYKPSYLFLDGSLYVKARRRPINCKEDSIYRKKFARLMKECRTSKVNLVGVSEDSRSKLFSNYLKSKYRIDLPKFITDSSILKLIAGSKAYRTIEFTPKSRIESEEKKESFPTVYMQVNEYANPLRVDIADWNNSMDEAISLITHLSKGSRYYGYPIPLYLVHLDAHIQAKHAEWTSNQLSAHIQKKDPELYDAVLRRNRRSLRPN